jgi:hypothetical protein
MDHEMPLAFLAIMEARNPKGRGDGREILGWGYGFRCYHARIIFF